MSEVLNKELKERMNKLRQVKDVVYSNQESNCFNITETLKIMVKENPNDYDLGKVVREFCLNNFK